MRLSVLDQSPIPEGETAGDALRNTIDLAQHCEVLGYQRYWVAEHHNTDALAGSSPEVLIGSITGATDHIRVGSGGVMLTHYAPLKVAENFSVLSALYPGRIDLGVGRAPGSDQLTADALAPSGRRLDLAYYPSQVDELVHLLDGTLPDDSPIKGIRATPRPAEAPVVWLLASSPDSASFAAHFGLPLAWADFIAQSDGAEVVDAYRDQFRPSARCPEPQVLVAVSALCADTTEEALRASASVRTWRERGLQGPIPASGEKAAPTRIRLPIRGQRNPFLTGAPNDVGAAITDIAGRYGTDEIMVVTICHSHQARKRSYELLAEEFELKPA